MTGWLGVGNERVYRGRDGWLFYRPDVEYVTGPRFLDPAQLERRARPRPSNGRRRRSPIRARRSWQFKRDLDARGITLIVDADAGQAGHPSREARRGATRMRRPAAEPVVPRVRRRPRRDGVLVLRPVGSAGRRARTGGPQYLATDTHWRPEAMEAGGGAARRLHPAHVTLPCTPIPATASSAPEVRNIGDTARMLDLPTTGTLFPPEAVVAAPRPEPDGAPWRPSRDADVLVLGDSFSNIYSLASMGWGDGARASSST